MSSARILEVNSTYRNRNMWPYPSEFEIPISQTGRKSQTDAIDPVSQSAPFAAWTSNDFNTSSVPSRTVSMAVATASGTDPLPGLNTGTIFIVSVSAGTSLQQLTDYYVGASIENTTTSEFRRVAAYRYLGVDSTGRSRAQFTVDSSFGSSFAAGDTLVVSDPTDITTDTSFPQIFVPAGRTGINGYAGNILYNETQNEYRTITDYNADTHVLTIDATTVVSTWANTDNFSIRKLPPAVVSNTTSASTTSTVVVSAGIANADNAVGQFIRIRPSVYSYGSLVAPSGEISRITAYDSSTYTATVFPAFSASVGSLSTLTNIIEVLPFSYDNLYPFVYSGSLVSQQEMVCYEIELLDLVLPNTTLNSGNGSRIAFYPYVYVELANVSAAGSGLVNTIYSNDPNATRMIFRAPIDDVVNPLVSSFVKVDGDGAVQTIKFKPNDNLRFSVHLPNGELFQSLSAETYSPYEPNPLIQISAMFSIKRI